MIRSTFFVARKLFNDAFSLAEMFPRRTLGFAFGAIHGTRLAVVDASIIAKVLIRRPDVISPALSIASGNFPGMFTLWNVAASNIARFGTFQTSVAARQQSFNALAVTSVLETYASPIAANASVRVFVKLVYIVDTMTAAGQVVVIVALSVAREVCIDAGVVAKVLISTFALSVTGLVNGLTESIAHDG